MGELFAPHTNAAWFELADSASGAQAGVHAVAGVRFAARHRFLAALVGVTVGFADIDVPQNADPPSPQTLGQLPFALKTAEGARLPVEDAG